MWTTVTRTDNCSRIVIEAHFAGPNTAVNHDRYAEMGLNDKMA